MGWPNGSIRPGEVFYDKLSATRYEKCVLGPRGERGGTGEFFKALMPPGDDAAPEDWKAFTAAIEDEANELIMDAERGCFVTLVRDFNGLDNSSGCMIFSLQVFNE